MSGAVKVEVRPELDASSHSWDPDLARCFVLAIGDNILLRLVFVNTVDSSIRGGIRDNLVITFGKGSDLHSLNRLYSFRFFS